MRPLFRYALCLVVMTAAASAAHAQVTVGGIDQLSSGLDGQAPAGASGTPAIASNGKFLAFNSSAPNLIAGDSNQRSDIFLENLSTDALSLASVNSSQVQGNGD